MNGWLAGKRARIEGGGPAMADALAAAGATLVASDADIWVHVAPPPAAKAAHDLTHAEWRASLDAGLDRRFLGAKEFAEQCRARGQGGAILFIGAPEQALGADQAAAAGALGNLTKTLGVEWARDGIRVNSILTQETGPTLGHLAAYLVSDYAAYVTGAVMGIALDD
ncbi:NAD(P)-dependent dehydrogenase (short-subunit alcohol dehydrogenase family) [Sphingopyxis panaciterrae]|uniref:SDR family oxidoreductase n=1 Tax=Sphingopyxis panaciterrae TaxID=363841 RepID=UPI0014228D4B|nr:SDR family oxidoreductase [Sphingopyxis panaciterrae]NIJ36750.1 NAD(P)-dependent dehydrogenase (short-subunit alcohol dehydrogenase family) [Sphingopyxis panaciterrae]